MVKNSLKKLKMPKEEVMALDKSSEVSDHSFPSKMKKTKVNGVAPESKKKLNGGGIREVELDRQKPVHPHGNLKKRLRDENKFISDVLEFMIFPKSNDVNNSDSDAEGDIKICDT
jgi:hypothetical protein